MTEQWHGCCCWEFLWQDGHTAHATFGMKGHIRVCRRPISLHLFHYKRDPKLASLRLF